MQDSGHSLDVICLGRSSVDLYGQQVGGRLEDMSSFAKYIGGSPTNIAIGAARLGLKSAMITRVGDEHMGRFIRETFEREGVDTRAVVTDPERLTALVILGIRDQQRFPLIFYRENCADMAIDEDDIDPDFISSARAVVVTGTHFSTPQVARASFRLIRCAREFGRKVVFDIDYRPNLWALGKHNEGESRFAENAKITSHLQKILPHCDLIVGTEEEWHIAGGSTDTIAALQRGRALTEAVLVCKRGALGCAVFAGAVESFDRSEIAPAQKIEIFNVLGAGDGFMAGFLRGWLRDEPLFRCAEMANACGALAVSRHGCAPAYPSEKELFHFLQNGSKHFSLRQDKTLEQIHWSTTAVQPRPQLLAFAFDHRSQFLCWAEQHGRTEQDIAHFKQLALEAVYAVREKQPQDLASSIGVLIDDRLGRNALYRTADRSQQCPVPLWVGRPIEFSGQFPLAFEHGPDLGSALNSWPVQHTVKVLAPVRLDDPEDMISFHEQQLVHLADAVRQTGHAFLMEIVTAREDRAFAADQVPVLMRRFYDLGIYPDWWKLEPVADAGYWQACGDVVRAGDPNAKGIIILGKAAEAGALRQIFSAACCEPLVNGFAIGRTIFAEPAQRWLAGEISDQQAVQKMAQTFDRLVSLWQQAGTPSGGAS